MNVIELVEENAIMPSTKRRILGNGDSIPKSDVLEFVEELEGEGEGSMADRVRQSLL